MANEITVNTTVKVANGPSLSHVVNTTSDQTTAGVVAYRQSIPTSDTVITLTGVTTPVLISIENTDATNYVDIGNTTGGAILEFARIQPGKEINVWLFPGVVLRAKAHTGAVVIRGLIVNT